MPSHKKCFVQCTENVFDERMTEAVRRVSHYRGQCFGFGEIAFCYADFSRNLSVFFLGAMQIDGNLTNILCKQQVESYS